MNGERNDECRMTNAGGKELVRCEVVALVRFGEPTPSPSKEGNGALQGGAALRWTRALLVAALFGVMVTAGVCAEAPRLTAAQTQFFETKIRPLLSAECYKCHSREAERVKGGLFVDTREGLLKGGKNGPSIIPGNPEKSLLIKAESKECFSSSRIRHAP